jgi:hypothetical protein
MRAWPAAVVAVAIGLSPAAQAQIAVSFDILNVLKVAYYPVQVMAYCYKEVQQNAKYQTIGSSWLKRNQTLLTQIEGKAKAENISNALRVQSDTETLETIKKTVASQMDKIAYCGLISSVIDGGAFDLNVRDDLKEPLKRIFPQ